MSLPPPPPNDLPPASDLSLEDFRRLGVRPFESRATVIRLAALRSSRTLAKSQLQTPSPQGSQQLARVMASAYRLLDPRRRDEPIQRALVGRIMPQTLSVAGQTHFQNGHHGPDPRESAIEPPELEDRHQNFLTVETETPPNWTISLDQADLVGSLQVRQSVVRGHRAQRRRRKFGWVAVIVGGSMIGAVAGLATIGKPKLFVSDQNQVVHPSEPSLNGSARRDADQASPPVAEADLPDSGQLDPLVESQDRAGSNQQTTTQPTTQPTGQPTTAPMQPPADWAIQDEAVGRSKQPAESPASIAASPVGVASSTGDRVASVPDRRGADPEESALDPPWAAGEQSELGLAEELAAKDDQSESVRSPPAREPIDANRRFAVPSQLDTQAARRDMAESIPVLSESVNIESINSRISQMELHRTQSRVGSPAHWAASMAIAEHHWLTQPKDAVTRHLVTLSQPYRVDLLDLSASTFSGACDLARLPETDQHLCDSGLRLLDELLIAESVDACRMMVESLSVLRLESEPQRTERLREFAESVEQLERLSAATRRWMLADDQTVATSDSGIAGRYYCLLLRQWNTGLSWLTNASDKRIARVAKQDLVAIETTERLLVAQRWRQIANRYDGRFANSMRLRAIELMQATLPDLTEIGRLDTEREIVEITESIPADLRDRIGGGQRIPANWKQG